MHIPDGFLTANTCGAAWLISIAGVSFCLRRATLLLKEKAIPLMGVVSAFVFAAQMLNFPILYGTSGHLLGGVLTVVLLGPYAASVVITIVLIIQCLIFQDGGLTTLGANILNMAFLGTIGGYFIYRLIRKIVRGAKGIMIGAAVASWCSVVIAAGACAMELAVSRTSPFKVVFPAMIFVHTFIGIGEAVITTFIISFILKVRPDLIYKI